MKSNSYNFWVMFDDENNNDFHLSVVFTVFCQHKKNNFDAKNSLASMLTFHWSNFLSTLNITVLLHTTDSLGLFVVLKSEN